jgi:hypothetical protein
LSRRADLLFCEQDHVFANTHRTTVTRERCVVIYFLVSKTLLLRMMYLRFQTVPVLSDHFWVHDSLRWSTELYYIGYFSYKNIWSKISFSKKAGLSLAPGWSGNHSWLNWVFLYNFIWKLRELLKRKFPRNLRLIY